MLRSYAAAAAEKSAVKFVYTESLPTSSVQVTRPPRTLVVKSSLYLTPDDAQIQFKNKAQDLSLLDTSGDLAKYVVSEANGSIVNFHHSHDVQTRYQDFKHDVKNLKSEMKDLKGEVKRLNKKIEDDGKIMIQWQVADKLLEGLYEKIWLAFSQRNQERLESLNIFDAKTALESRFTIRGSQTSRNITISGICDKISKENQNLLEELRVIKDRLQETRKGLAHPAVSLSDVNDFVEAFKPSRSFRSALEELKSMEVWSVRDNKKVKLFVK